MREREASPGAPGGPGHFWLRHVFPERFPRDPGDLTLDAVQVDLEAVVGRLASVIVRDHRNAAIDPVAGAVNFVTREVLALQRERSPEGYAAMVATALSEDPLLGELRAGINAASLAAAHRLMRRALRRGIRIGLAIACILAAWGCMLARAAGLIS